MLVAGLAHGGDDHVRALRRFGDRGHVVSDVGHRGIPGVLFHRRRDGQAFLGGGPAAHQGVHIAGPGADHQDVHPAVLLQRQGAVVLQQRHGLPGRFQVQRGMLFISDKGHGVFHVAVGILEHAQLEFGLYDAGCRRGQDRFVDLAFVGQVFHLVDQLDGLAADTVHAALRDADDDRFLIGNRVAGHGALAFLDSPDHAPVGLDDAFKAHLLAQQVLQRGLGADRAVFHVQRQRHGVVGHHGADVHFDRGVVGLQVDLQRLLVRHDGGRVLAVHLRAGAGEVLDAGHDAVLVDAVGAVLERDDLRLHHGGHQVGILAEGFHHAAPAGFGGDVALRAQGHAHADGDVLFAGHFGQLGHQFLVPGGGQAQVMAGHRRAGHVAQAVHRVHGNQHRHAQPARFRVFLHGVHGFRRALHAVQFADQQHADAVIGAVLLQIGSDLPVRPRQIGGMLHLRDLFPYGHLADQVGRAGVRVQPPVFIYVQCAVSVQVDELVSVRLDNGLHMGIQDRLLVSCCFLCGGKAHHAARQRQGSQQGDEALQIFLSQQGSSLLSLRLL